MQGRNNGLSAIQLENRNASQGYPRTDRCRLPQCGCSGSLRGFRARFSWRLGTSWLGHGGFGFGGIYVNTGVSDCYQQRYIQTRHGVRLRTVNVCAYNVY